VRLQVNGEEARPGMVEGGGQAVIVAARRVPLMEARQVTAIPQGFGETMSLRDGDVGGRPFAVLRLAALQPLLFPLTTYRAPFLVLIRDLDRQFLQQRLHARQLGGELLARDFVLHDVKRRRHVRMLAFWYQDEHERVHALEVRITDALVTLLSMYVNCRFSVGDESGRQLGQRFGGDRT